MREIFPRRDPADTDPGEVFYTLRAEDVGKTVLDTEIGPVRAGEVIGRVLKCDIGKRLIRTRSATTRTYYWRAENEKQMYERKAREEQGGPAATEGGNVSSNVTEVPARTAEVLGARDEEQVEAYLPRNYRVTGSHPGEFGLVVEISGKDVCGWTLDDYVIPRLGSGNMGCRETTKPRGKS